MSAREGYALWASHYDVHDNPMTTMVEHVLSQSSIDLRGAKVLELGCGTGRNARTLLNSGVGSYLGLDSSPEMLEVAGAAACDVIQFKERDLQGHWWTGLESFDLCLISLVLEHFENIEEVINAATHVVRPGGPLSTPKGQTRTRQLSKKLGVSQSSISRVWRAFKLQPHRESTFTLSTDDFFVEKVRDVVGLYMNRPDNAMVLCVDEKSQIQALERMQPVLPMVFGQPKRKTPSYLRHGTTTLFAALDIATGKVIGECYPRHRAIEFRNFLNIIDKQVPADLQIHIVMDNYATHSTPEIQAWLDSHPRFHFHFIPTYSSWLNQVERWFGLLTERALKQSVHRSTTELESTIREYIDATNDAPKPFLWVKSANQIASVMRHCQYVLNYSQ